MKNSKEKCPRSYLGLALFATCLFFFPLGFFAIYNGALVKKYWEYGDIEEARKKSKKARMWSLITIAAGLIFYLFFGLFTEFVSQSFK